MEHFKARHAAELPPINAALADGLNLLPAPCRPVASHIFSAGGKRLRPLLTILFGRLFGDKSTDIYRLAASMEFLHAATLLHDDILDQAETRRNKPASHMLFGAQVTILAGDALLATGNALVASFGNPALTLAYSTATMETAAGEILEMSSLGRADLTHDQYVEIARGKTACLIAQACMLGALKADADELAACAEFGENLGLAFQLVDDILDFADPGQTGKPRGGDLREGKMTPPIRLYRASLADSERKRFDEAFMRHGFSPAELELHSARIAPYAVDCLPLADDCLRKANEALRKLPDAPEKIILEEMAEYVRSRKK